jgi:hypothetical protein
MDLTIRTRNRAAEARCRACRSLDDPDSPWPSDLEHSCRRAPATPAATVAARRRRHEQTRLERELGIRAQRLADLDA